METKKDPSCVKKILLILIILLNIRKIIFKNIISLKLFPLFNVYTYGWVVKGGFSLEISDEKLI